jgi:hypothetical protein
MNTRLVIHLYLALTKLGQYSMYNTSNTSKHASVIGNVPEVNHYSSFAVKGHASPSPCIHAPFSESTSDSYSGTWSSPTPSIAYSSSSSRLSDHCSTFPAWAQEAPLPDLYPYTSLDQAQFQPDNTAPYDHEQMLGHSYLQTPYPSTSTSDFQHMGLVGVGEWAIDEYSQPSSEQMFTQSPAAESTSTITSMAAESHSSPTIKQEDTAQDQHDCPKLLVTARQRTHKLVAPATKAVTKAFPCPFLPYACLATFSSKNEWKRHVNTQHLSLSTYYCHLCSNKPCQQQQQQTDNTFNRKDLFIQHLRRMHCHSSQNTLYNNDNNTKLIDNTPASLAYTALCCHMPSPSLPTSTTCIFCSTDFSGLRAWTDRTEHISRHLETWHRDGQEVPSVHVWRKDVELEAWCVENGVLAFCWS